MPKLFQKHRVKGVERFGAVERDDAHLITLLDQYHFIVHGKSPLFRYSGPLLLAQSLLAGGAIKGRTTGLYHSLNRTPAAGCPARLAFLIVDRKGMLEITERSVRLYMVAQ